MLTVRAGTRLFLPLCLLALAPLALHAQGQTDQCRPGGGNRALKAQLAAGRIPRLRFEESTPILNQRWATSMRVPPPAVIRAAGAAPLDVATASCEYGAGMLRDGDSTTCWCEGAAGPGVGELVITKLDPDQPARIRGGDQRGDSAFAASNRPRRVRLWVLEGDDLGNPIEGEDWRRLRVAGGSAIVELRDVAGWQNLRLPRYALRPITSPDDSPTIFVAIEILSVYPGREGAHTCISDVESYQP